MIRQLKLSHWLRIRIKNHHLVLLEFVQVVLLFAVHFDNFDHFGRLLISVQLNIGLFEFFHSFIHFKHGAKHQKNQNHILNFYILTFVAYFVLHESF